MNLAQHDRYAGEVANNYSLHHDKNFRTQLTNWREKGVLKGMLKSCEPLESLLDLPCGTGRFWPVFEELKIPQVVAGDYSQSMLDVAARNAPDVISFESRQMDLLNLNLSANSFDVISCMRFFHHLAHAEDRNTALSQIHKVTRRYAVISLWIDGNLRSYQRRNKPIRHEAGFGRRVCLRREQVEYEFRTAGFRIVSSNAIWPGISMWQLYLLEKQ